VGSYYPSSASSQCYQPGSQSDIDTRLCMPCDCTSITGSEKYIAWQGCNGSYGIDGVNFNKGECLLEGFGV